MTYLISIAWEWLSHNSRVLGREWTIACPRSSATSNHATPSANSCCLTNSGWFGREPQYIKCEPYRRRRVVFRKCQNHVGPQQDVVYVRLGVRNAMKPSLSVCGV
ncbi:hypothetical protein OPQ81_010340 [Rhizoctonia solani]|nr:hypothetical protein OPQ81_010340 [Rhizoctonia solani]